MNERRCHTCGQRKALDCFEDDAWNPRNKNADPCIRMCLTCKKLNKYVTLPGNVNVEKLITKGKDIERMYGITLKQYEGLYIKQNGLCAICHHPEPVKSRLFLAVDHDHKTGYVRGLLCSKCNTAIGLFEDSLESLYSAIRYLQTTSQRKGLRDATPSRADYIKKARVK